MACNNTGISLRLLRGQWVPSREKEEYASGFLHLTVPLPLSKGFSLLPEKREARVFWQKSDSFLTVFSCSRANNIISCIVSSCSGFASAELCKHHAENFTVHSRNAQQCPLYTFESSQTVFAYTTGMSKAQVQTPVSLNAVYMLGRDHRHPKVCAS